MKELSDWVGPGVALLLALISQAVTFGGLKARVHTLEREKDDMGERLSNQERENARFREMMGKDFVYRAEFTDMNQRVYAEIAELRRFIGSGFDKLGERIDRIRDRSPDRAPH